MHISITKKLAVSFSVFVLTLLMFVLFRTVPVSQLWKGYKIIYVQTEKLTDENITAILYKNGARNVISTATQKIPVSASFAPVQTQKKSSWLNLRNSFFTDSTGKLKLFYVPDSQTEVIENSLDELNCFADTTAGADGAPTFPWISPVITILFSLVLIYFSSKKGYFLASAFPFMILAFSRPLYTMCGACILILIAFFLMQKLWERQEFLKDFKHGLLIIPFSFIPVIILPFSSFASSFFIILGIVSSVSLVLVFTELKKQYELNRGSTSFKFVFIKKASQIKIFNTQSLFALSGAAFATVLLLVLSSLFSGISTDQDFEDRPLLPSPVASGTGEEMLPDLRDFMDWSWETASFPYRKLGSHREENEEENLPDSSIYISDYVLNTSGKLEKKEVKVLSYDSSFEASIYDKVNQLDYPALEKMMMKQGKKSRYAYTRKSGNTSEKAVPFVLILFTFVPVFLSAYYLTGKVRNGINL